MLLGSRTVLFIMLPSGGEYRPAGIHLLTCSHLSCQTSGPAGVQAAMDVDRQIIQPDAYATHGCEAMNNRHRGALTCW